MDGRRIEEKKRYNRAMEKMIEKHLFLEDREEMEKRENEGTQDLAEELTDLYMEATK